MNLFLGVFTFRFSCLNRKPQALDHFPTQNVAEKSISLSQNSVKYSEVTPVRCLPNSFLKNPTYSTW